MKKTTTRTRYDIIAEILEASINGVSEGKLCTLVKKNRRDIKGYLAYCRKQGLITGNWAFYTTPKGRNFLQIYERLMKALEDSNRMWKQRKEWLKQRVVEASGSERVNRERVLKNTDIQLKKSRTERVLDLLIAMSEQENTVKVAAE